MNAPSFDWEHLRNVARGVVRRYRDRWTNAHAEDLAQEALLAFWEWVSVRGAQVREPVAAITTIVKRCRHRLRDLARWQWTLPFPVFQDAGGEWTAEPEAPPQRPYEDLADAVADCVREGPDGALLHARLFGRASDAELAELTGWSPKACRARVHRARVAVRAALRRRVADLRDA